MKSVALYLSVLSLASMALGSSSCVAFDAGWNLLAFNLGGKDYNAGTKDSWSSGTPTDITTSGRPPFNGKSVSCFLAQAANAIYVVGADSANPSSVHIYDPNAKSWTTQATNVGSTGYDPATAVSILDHNTDVLYSFSKGSLFLLRLEDIKAAKSDAIAWEAAGTPTFPVDGYQPVMGLAMNHIHFLNVPNGQKGFANIYVIHFGEYQPEPQKYGDFPSTHGQTASVFLDSNQPQNEFIFVPDDGSATYVVNVVSNTTQSLTGPPGKDADASYFASPDTFVQYSPSKGISFMPYSAAGASANQNAQWSSVAKLASVASSGGGGSTTPSGSSAGGVTPTKSSGAGTSASSPTGNSTSTSNKDNAAASTQGQRRSIVLGLSFAVGLGSLAIALL